ncbi:MAG: hypothetical protein QW429_01490 [Thermoprotei archaeon]
MNETLLQWRTELIKTAINVGAQIDRDSIYYQNMQLYFSELEKQYVAKTPKEALVLLLNEKKREKQEIIAGFVQEIQTINDMLFLLGEKI